MKEVFHLKSKVIPLYKIDLTIVITNSIDKLTRVIPEFEGDSIFAHTWRYVYKRRDSCIVILNPYNKASKLTLGTIAHESVHVASFTHDYIGAIPNYDNDETFACLTEYVTDEIIKYMNKLNIKI